MGHKQPFKTILAECLLPGAKQSFARLRKRLLIMFGLARPPDPDLIGLIEQAFFAGQIDRQKADLAFL